MAILVRLDNSRASKALAYFICDALEEDERRRRRPRGLLQRLWDARKPDVAVWPFYPWGVAFNYDEEAK